LPPISLGDSKVEFVGDAHDGEDGVLEGGEEGIQEGGGGEWRMGSGEIGRGRRR